MSNAKETKVEDHDYSLQPVPQFARRRLLTMFMIMLGFTFFSASMWTGQTLGDSLDLSGFIGSLILEVSFLQFIPALWLMSVPKPDFPWICWHSIPSVQRAPICRLC